MAGMIRVGLLGCGTVGGGVVQLLRANAAYIAARIGAPTTADLAVPVDAVPTDGGLLAFRQVGAWA